MAFVSFVISAIAGSLLVVLSIATVLVSGFDFWPPPRKESWQYVVFWSLFRLLVLGIFVTSVLDFWGLGAPSFWQLVAGATVAVVGFGSAFHATYALGWRDAHGEAVSLNTKGWYSWSRNPVYVVSIVGMVGIGAAVHSLYVYLLLLLWTLIYVVAPYLEEPWLEQNYGNAFREYKSRVNRFVGRRQSAS